MWKAPSPHARSAAPRLARGTHWTDSIGVLMGFTGKRAFAVSQFLQGVLLAGDEIKRMAACSVSRYRFSSAIPRQTQLMRFLRRGNC